jgi:hypothetical protein
MIDAGPSLDTAEGVNGAALQRYLVAKGWVARPSRISGMSILSRRISGSEQEVEVLLPMAPDFGDERRRVADALRSAAAIEGRSEASISEDVRSLESAEHDYSAAGNGAPTGCEGYGQGGVAVISGS